ncbi:alginate O-acetyltransferase AlgX-related protein [Actinokineospora bangkokensis]|uniref:AlgX/AlgJ SGNH hydrolase-like domain-containing protein n=1 Tax=Actinokineospora bangkokensis TaxID=1193682 RepID=A0A1Q9LU71_9PSEU|nr:hypothetical protein [Actinokineospora bangkokensis]OLR95570.1 hypothetical protein BJP25_00305 [Actinokineospora bangkokensis]
MSDQPPVPQLPPVHEAWLPREHSLHRPRHGPRQKLALISALVFFALPTVLYAVGVRPAEIENHPLAGFPGLGDGWGFFRDFDPWATDNLSFRPAAIAVADGVSRGVFGEPPTFGQQEVDTGPLGGGPTPAPAPGRRVEQPGQQGPAQAANATVIEGTDGWLYFGGDMSAKCQPSRPFAQTVDLLKRLQRAVESSGREFVLVVAPDKSTQVPEHLPANYDDKECAAAARDRLWKLIEGAQTFDMRAELQGVARGLGRPPYYRLDTHWTDEGALAMTRRVAEEVRPGVSATWTTSPRARFAVGADLPGIQGKRGDKEGTIYSLRPDGESDRTQEPRTNLSTPFHRGSEPVQGTIDKPTLFLGDSFTGVSVPYVSAIFTDLTVLSYLSSVDRPADTIAQLADNEVVVFEIVERALAVGGGSWLTDQFINDVQAELATRPIRR